MTKDKFKKAYTQHKSNAKARGIDFLFTFNEWKEWWIASGNWELRGRGREKYCMRRYGDVGPYSVDNVFCGTNEENVRDGNIGKTVNKETRKKISLSHAGKPHPWSAGKNNPMHRQECRDKISKATSGSKHYAAKTVVTPHGTWGSATEAARALNIPIPTVNWRCKHQRFGFSYLAIA